VTSTTVATVVATVVTYAGNRYWSFRHRERTGVAREGTIFLLLNGIGILIQDATVAFNAYALDMPHNKLAEFIALNTGIAIATVFRFLSYRRWVWQAPAASVPAPADPSEPGPQPAGNGEMRPLPPMISANGHSPASRDGNGASVDGPDPKPANRR
jgi:putative flippase GtrA